MPHDNTLQCAQVGANRWVLNDPQRCRFFIFSRLPFTFSTRLRPCWVLIRLIIRNLLLHVGNVPCWRFTVAQVDFFQSGGWRSHFWPVLDTVLFPGTCIRFSSSRKLNSQQVFSYFTLFCDTFCLMMSQLTLLIRHAMTSLKSRWDLDLMLSCISVCLLHCLVYNVYLSS